MRASGGLANHMAGFFGQRMNLSGGGRDKLSSKRRFPAMTSRQRLATLVFAILWTAFMLQLTGGSTIAHIAIIATIAVLVARF